MLSRKANLIPVLIDNFFGFPGFIRLIVIAFSLYILFISSRESNTLLIDDPKYIFSWLSLLITSLQLLLSILGLIPWHSSTRWSIEDLSFLLVFMILFWNPSKWLGAKLKLKTFRSVVFLIPSAFTVFALTFYSQGEFMTIKRNTDLQIAKTLVVPSIERGLFAEFLISKDLYPTLRYSLELDPRYNPFKAGWIDSKVTLFSTSEEFKLSLRSSSRSFTTIIYANEPWIYQELLKAGYRCSIVTRLQDFDYFAPSWISIRIC